MIIRTYILMITCLYIFQTSVQASERRALKNAQNTQESNVLAAQYQLDSFLDAPYSVRAVSIIQLVRSLEWYILYDAKTADAAWKIVKMSSFIPTKYQLPEIYEAYYQDQLELMLFYNKTIQECRNEEEKLICFMTYASHSMTVKYLPKYKDIRAFFESCDYLYALISCCAQERTIQDMQQDIFNYDTYYTLIYVLGFLRDPASLPSFIKSQEKYAHLSLSELTAKMLSISREGR